jgi:alpha-beta hydrolase superfamily lysophospholipase
MRLPFFATPFEQYRTSTAALWRQAVAEELAALRQTHSRVILVGHSLGGALALACAAEHDADGLVLLAPLLEVSARYSPLLTPETWCRVLNHALVFTDRVGLYFMPLLRNPGALARWKTDVFIPRDIFSHVFDLLDGNRDCVSSIHTPVFMVVAQEDEIVDNQAAERFFETCPSAQKRLLRLAGFGHLIPRESCCSCVVDDVFEFLAELPSAGPIGTSLVDAASDRVGD